jgi:phosphoglycolate phosphatase-like HAD superfamily hydrolase
MGVETEIGKEQSRAILIQSDIETFPDQERPADIKIKVDANGVPETMAFFDIDNTLAECGFIHGKAAKRLFAEAFPDQDSDRMTELYLKGIYLGTTFRVFHRMIGIAGGKTDWEDPEAYLKWLHENPKNLKDVDESGSAHNLAAELSMKGSQMAAQIAEEMFKQNPEIFRQSRIKPVFHLAKLYQRLGIPMMVMTANDEPFAKAICKCLGLADSFITMACQKDFVGQGKEGAMGYLIKRAEEKGIRMPKNLIVVGDSLNGDIGSGAKFMQEHAGCSVKGVLVVEKKEEGEGKEEIAAAQERIKKDPLLKNMSVDVLMPEEVGYDGKGVPNLASYRRKFQTKP